MTGRGGGKLMRPNPNPSVTIGLRLSTSPESLPVSSEEPFYIVVTARILTSPLPHRSITLWTHLSPLHHLSTRAFENIKCTTREANPMEIWPRSWPQYRWDAEDIQPRDEFVTIPPLGHGALVIRHQVPADAIKDAHVQKGDKYRVKLTDKCLGTRWWTFGTREELEGVRFRSWRSGAVDAGEEMSVEESEEVERGRGEKYGDRPSTQGEDPDMLAIVPEVGEVEFDVV